MIIEAKKKCPAMNIQISKCEETPFENDKFDVLTSCMAYHHFADKKGFAKEAARIIKTGGYLYIADVYFPLMIRKIINTILKIHRIAGYFGTSKEIYENFIEFDFVDVIRKGYTQLIVLKKYEHRA